MKRGIEKSGKQNKRENRAECVQAAGLDSIFAALFPLGKIRGPGWRHVAQTQVSPAEIRSSHFRANKQANAPRFGSIYPRDHAKKGEKPIAPARLPNLSVPQPRNSDKGSGITAEWERIGERLEILNRRKPGIL